MVQLKSTFFQMELLNNRESKKKNNKFKSTAILIVNYFRNTRIIARLQTYTTLIRQAVNLMNTLLCEIFC